ncbi:MAG: ATP-binding protein [Gammaproteobacteria bacterium]|nr:ATP-binding protein [Gammaproteobacteria bacterium]
MSQATESPSSALFALVSIADSDLRWRVLRLLNLFRTIWSGLFAVLFYQDAAAMFGSVHPLAYEITAFSYFGLAIAFSFTIQGRSPSLVVQTYGQLFIDLAALIILAHASGGQLSGLASLLFVVVAAGSILMPGRIAVLYAAIATIAVLVEQFVAHLEGFTEASAYTSAGITGFILLGTAVLGARVARRYRESEALAERRGLDLQNLSLVNDHIIQNMKTGVVVMDANGIIRQLNRPAAKLFGLPEKSRNSRVADSRKLQDILDHWETHPDEAIPSVGDGAGNVFLPRIQEIRGDRRNGLMLLLEDAQIAAEQVQQMKLAALGRLTGSIAHEIRNPIGAISHANQLLAEAELSAGDRRFVEIIGKQTERVNEIIENVLQLGRRDEHHPEQLELTGWLRDFVMEYCDTHGLPLETIDIEGTAEDTMVRMDPSHLRQILSNLLDNARVHAERGPEGEVATLRITQDPNRNQAWLDVVDFGAGVPDEIVNRIFEPFYTHSRSGTGLGLFIARELCECNHASLLYGQDGDGYSCFRITFQDEPSWLM